MLSGGLLAYADGSVGSEGIGYSASIIVNNQTSMQVGASNTSSSLQPFNGRWLVESPLVEYGFNTLYIQGKARNALSAITLEDSRVKSISHSFSIGYNASTGSILVAAYPAGSSGFHGVHVVVAEYRLGLGNSQGSVSASIPSESGSGNENSTGNGGSGEGPSGPSIPAPTLPIFNPLGMFDEFARFWNNMTFGYFTRLMAGLFVLSVFLKTRSMSATLVAAGVVAGVIAESWIVVIAGLLFAGLVWAVWSKAGEE